MKRVRSIKKTVIFSISLLVVFVAMSTVFLMKANQSLRQEADLHLQELALRGADQAGAVIDGHFSLLSSLAETVWMDQSLSQTEKLEKLQHAADLVKTLHIGYAFTDGQAYIKGIAPFNVSESNFFKEAMKGNPTITKALANQSVAPKSWIMAVPVTEGGKVTGVLFEVVAADQLNSILNVSFFSGHGYSYIIDNDGLILMSQTESEIDQNFYDILMKEGTNSRDLQGFESFIRANQSGSTDLRLDGQDYFCSFASMKSINNDVLNILCVAPKSYVFGGAWNVLITSICACAGLFIIFVGIFLLFIRQIKKHNTALTHMAYYDQLTGLPNFDRFCLDCQKRMEHGPAQKYAVAVFDINRFKRINDTFGYGAGDQVLRDMAGLLRQDLTATGDLCGRISSDIFVCHLEASGGESKIAERVMHLHNLFETLLVSGMEIKPRANFGICMILDNSADIRPYVDDAKVTASLNKGQNLPYAFYDKELQERLQETAQIKVELEQAFERKELEVYYQPLISFSTKAIVSAEALVRWNHPTKGMIMPMTFIPIAEKSTLIYKVGRFVFEQVCIHLHEWKKHDTPLPVSVNISRLELYEEDLIPFMLDALKRYDLDVSQFEIELTETAAIEDMDFLRNMLLKFKSVGFRVAMDDFGTGYSSLNCLSTLPFDVVKFDRTLIRGVNHEKGIETLRSMVALAKSLGFEVVAEGIETEEEANFLAAMNCDIAQGFYYAHPMKKEALELFAFPTI